MSLNERVVTRLEELFPIDPADDVTAATRPQGIVVVVAELQMMRREAGGNELIVARLRIHH